MACRQRGCNQVNITVKICLFVFVGNLFAANSSHWILDYKGGRNFDDERARALVNSIAPKDWADEISDRMTIPPSLDSVFGDSVALFSSCKFQSCDEKQAFVYDLKANTGVFINADQTETQSSALVLSKTCTREDYENRYRAFFDSWKRKEKILVSSEIFWMKPTPSDTALMKAHDAALKEFKARKTVSTMDDFLSSASKSSALYGSFNIAANNDLGFFLEKANRAAEAIPVLEKVIGFDPTRTSAYLNLADAYFKTGDKTKAKANYQKYVELMDKAGKGTKVPARVRAYLKP